MALALAGSEHGARAAAFRALAAPPAPLAPVLGPVHRLQCAARTTVAPGCLLGGGSLLVTPDAWAPAGGAPLLNVPAKTVALRRIARAARRLAPALCPLSSATTEQLDAALTAFADAALASHAALCKADKSVVRPLVASCADADAAADTRWGAVPTSRPRRLPKAPARRERGRSRGSTATGESGAGFSDSESDGEVSDAEQDSEEEAEEGEREEAGTAGGGEAWEGQGPGEGSSGGRAGGSARSEGREAVRHRRWLKRMRAASLVLGAEATARAFRPAPALGVSGGGAAEAAGAAAMLAAGLAAGTASALETAAWDPENAKAESRPAGGTAPEAAPRSGSPAVRAEGGCAAGRAASGSRRGSAGGATAASGTAKQQSDASVAGMAFRGLSDVVRATAAVAASAVAAAWQASAPSGQVVAYARAVRAAAAATEGLGMWLEAAVAGATAGCERQGPRLCLRDEAAIQAAASAAAGEGASPTPGSPARAAAAAPEEAGDGTGWELARSTAEWAAEPALRDWCLRAARLMESAGRRRRVIAALHVIGKGLCGAIAADIALLASLRIAAAKEAALLRPVLDG